MRLTFNMQYTQSLNGILNAQKRMANAESQLTNQTRILTPADDPAGAAKVLNLDQNKAQIDQYQINSVLLKNNLTLQETVLTNMRTSYDKITTLAQSTGNGIYAAEQRKAVALELQNIQTELFDLMNTRSSDGSYIFAGYQDKSVAYERDSITGEFVFKGDDGHRAMQISSSISLPGNDSGKAIFDNVFTRFKPELATGTAGVSVQVSNQTTFDNFYLGSYDQLDTANNQFSLTIDAAGNYNVLQNGNPMTPPQDGIYTPGSSIRFKGAEFTLDNNTALPAQVDFSLPAPEKTNVLNTLQNFIDVLNNPNVSDDDLQIALADTLQQVTKTANNVDSTLANIGGRQNVIDSVYTTNEDLLITNQKYKADISEVDLAAALTEIKRQEVALQAASQTFTKVNATTLFDYI